MINNWSSYRGRDRSNDRSRSYLSNWSGCRSNTMTSGFPSLQVIIVLSHTSNGNVIITESMPSGCV
jgi:hypothetical protein